MEKYDSIGDAIRDLEDLKSKFSYYQRCQENAKHNLAMYDPYDYEDEDVSKEEHERRYYSEIEGNKYILKCLENDIKELRKTIKKLNREQNQKNNKK